MEKKLEVSIVKFNQGAFITIENKPDSSSFYIIKEGKVKISREFRLNLNEKDIILQGGAFIGIISCMSGHPREETARALTPVYVIRIHKEQFKNLIQKNPNIAMKIIRFFSSKLRYIDEKMMLKENQAVKESLSEEQVESYIYKMGMFYHKNQDYFKAYYVFQKYLESYPKGQYFEEVENTLASLVKISEESMNTEAPLNELEDEKDKPSRLISKNYKNNTLIFCEYEIGKELFIIQEGQVKITKIIDNYEKIIAILKTGDIFGEMALLENQRRSATAAAYGDVKVLVVNQQNYESMVVTQPALSIKMIKILSERLWTGFRQLQNKSIQDITARILDGMMLNLEKEKKSIDKSSYTFNFGMKELFKMIDIDPEEGKPKFMNIIRNKILELSKDGKKIICDNLEDLQKEWIFEKNKESRRIQKQMNSLKSKKQNKVQEEK